MNILVFFSSLKGIHTPTHIPTLPPTNLSGLYLQAVPGAEQDLPISGVPARPIAEPRNKLAIDYMQALQENEHRIMGISRSTFSFSPCVFTVFLSCFNVSEFAIGLTGAAIVR